MKISEIAFVGIVVVIIAVAALFALKGHAPFTDIASNVSSNYTLLASPDLKNFSSWEEVDAFLQSASATSPRYGWFGIEETMIATSQPVAQSAADTRADSAASAESRDFSTTNVQVQGVDEADTLKNDGTYLYALTSGKIAIAKAYPASEAKLESVINDSVSYTGFFVNGDKLVGFGNQQFQWEPIQGEPEPAMPSEPGPAIGVVASRELIYPGPYYGSASVITVYDISNRSHPTLLKEIKLKGSYVTARMIGNKVYSIYTESAYGGVRPLIMVDDQTLAVQPSEISYIDEPFDYYQYTVVMGFDLNDLENQNREIVLSGGTETVYASHEAAYIAYTSYNYYQPTISWSNYVDVEPLFTPEYRKKLTAIEREEISQWRKDNLKIQLANEFIDSLNESQRNELYAKIYARQQNATDADATSYGEKTVVHKFSLGDDIHYLGKGQVPGHLLNQFALDEHNGYLRLATTIGEVWRGNGNGQMPATNNIYVLDNSLNLTGKLEGLAPGETLYSSRFMGDKAYLVTFKKVDPLFVIDLSNPQDPQLLGKLKIPGYSDYLHPFGENHLIGLGKDAVPAEEGDFAWYQGVKLSLFDVSNLSNPVELSTYTIGDRGTESYALHDHKAFLFNPANGLLVIPVTLAEVDPSQHPQGVRPETYGDYKFQGAYVFNVDIGSGFQLRGTVSHANQDELLKSGEYYYGSGTDVERSAYIDNVLYTVSQKYIKANDLTDLNELANVTLPFQEIYGGPYYIE